MRLSPGDRFDRYIVEEFLGRGGMGEVYRVFDERLDRRIALKIIVGDGSAEDEPRARERLLREARAAAALDHPNVVAVFDVGDADGVPYLAMELVLGVTLRAFVGDPAITMRRRQRWLVEVARALDAAHARGLVHRDVKPENAMVRGDDAVKVLDFGIARRARPPGAASGSGNESGNGDGDASTLTRDGAVVGTLLYMAPEQVTGGAVDARTDQFAWGVMAAELLNGAHPWGTQPTTANVIAGILHVPVAVAPGVAPEMAAAIARATAKAPAARFASMREVLAIIDPDEHAAAPPVDAPATSAAATTFDEPARLPRGAWSVGYVVANRYEIVRLVARGGMGEVYEAIDRELATRVALKTLRGDRAADTRAVEQFRREIALARRIAHPNVVRPFDVGFHPTADATPRVTFLTMELLAGESLAERLRAVKRLSTRDALPIAREMAAALSAAHAASVIHRDFKPANVMLVPRTEGGERVVVTDFGLAREAFAPPGESARMLLVGTPAYLAPEQVGGQGAGAAADIYALGVVLFEMVTGALPFTAATPIETAMLRLSRAPPAPRSLVPGLDARWDAAISRCLARDPEARFARVSDVIAALEPRPAPRRAIAVAAALVVGVAVAAAAARIPATGARPLAATDAAPAPPPAAPATVRPSLAIVGLRNQTSDPRFQWLDGALGEMLRTELSANEGVRVVSGSETARAERDLSLASADDLPAADAARLREALGVQQIVDGGYVVVEAAPHRRVRVDLHLKDTTTGRTVASIAESGTEDALFEVIGRAAEALRVAMQLPGTGEPPGAVARASVPTDPGARRAYAEGLTRLHALDPLGAKERLERAVRIEPKFALAHAALSEALAALGYTASGADEAKLALDGSASLSREDRFRIEARYAEARYDWPRAIDAHRRLFGFFPDSLDYGLALAWAHERAGHPKEALATCAELRTLPSPIGDDPRIDLVAFEAEGHQSDLQAQRAFAESAHAKAVARKSPSLQAEADSCVARMSLYEMRGSRAVADELLRVERAFAAVGNHGAAATAVMRAGIALRQAGAFGDALRELDRALVAARVLGFRWLEMRTVTEQGTVLRRTDAAAARAKLTEALGLAREVGDQSIERGLISELALLDSSEGHLQDARAKLERSALIAASIGEVQDEINATDDLAAVLGRLGEGREALATHERLQKRYVELHGRRDEGITLRYEAEILIDFGDLASASSRLDEAERAGRETSDTESLALVGAARATIAWLRGDLAAARALFAEAIASQRDAGATRFPRRWEWALAGIDLEQGTARSADIRRWMQEDGESDAGAAALALSLAIEGKRTDSLAAARRALDLAKKDEAYRARVQATLFAARARILAGDGAEGAALARGLIADAKARGYVRWELEARLVTASAVSGEGARAELAAIEEAALARGLLLIASRAVSAMR